MAAKFTYKSFAKDVMRDIEYAQKNRVVEAAKHVRRNLRKVLNKKVKSRPGQPPGLYRGNLRKGVAWSKTGFYETEVGFSAPAQHAHLLEFGTRERRTEDGKSVGHVKPRPFFRPTFEASAPAVKRILSEKIF